MVLSHAWLLDCFTSCAAWVLLNIVCSPPIRWCTRNRCSDPQTTSTCHYNPSRSAKYDQSTPVSPQRWIDTWRCWFHHKKRHRSVCSQPAGWTNSEVERLCQCQSAQFAETFSLGIFGFATWFDAWPRETQKMVDDDKAMIGNHIRILSVYTFCLNTRKLWIHACLHLEGTRFLPWE